MATRFKSLKLRNADLFGVALSGSVGRRDHKSLQDLADRALAIGRVNVVLDLTEVTSIGGGGVKILASFQQDLLQADGELVFVGASEIMRKYLTRHFKELPQKHFATVDEMSEGPEAEEELQEPEGIQPSVATAEEVGAVSLQNEEESSEGLDGLLGQFKGSGGKRHHFVSLAEAVESLDFLASDDEQHRLTQALGDLLYGHDLAASVELLTRQDDGMLSTSGQVAVPFDGGMIPQIMAARRPMTILDLDNDVLTDDEISMLTENGPDMLLPIIYNGELFALLFLMNDGQEREYSVAETLALELLMQVISTSVAEQQQPVELPPAVSQSEILEQPNDQVNVTGELESPSDISETSSGDNDGQTLDSTLLRLAEDLPVAEDADHFWTLFARHTAASLGVVRLAYMGPDSDQANLYVGQGECCDKLNLHEDRFQVYLRSVERPVQVENLPKSFSVIGTNLQDTGIQWIISLNSEDEYLGAVLLQLDTAISSPDTEDYLSSIMGHISRHMAHFSGSHNQHDLNLELVRVLMGQREKRCFGTDEVTNSLVNQVRMLAREMGFPPAQERELIYGCLLRDIGLVGMSDQFAVNSGNMDMEEELLYQQHPAEGALMLAGLHLPPGIVEVVQGHHERFNGEGYPLGQKGREIPLTARVVSVVEHYVFMLTGAGGLPALNAAEAAEKLRMDIDGRFDPDIVQLFLDAVQRNKPEEEICPNTSEGEIEQDAQEEVPGSPSPSMV